MTVLIVAVLLIAVALVLLALGLVLGSQEKTGVARSLELVNYQASGQTVARHELGAGERLLDPILGRLRGLGTALTPTGAADSMARNLDKAGNPPAWTVDKVYGAKGTLLLIGLALGFLWQGLTLTGLVAMAVLGTFAFFLPDILVYNAGARRQEQLRKGLADSLDMLSVCVEAGQGFDAAIQQVARSTEGPIAGEFARVLSEIQIGRSRAEAFASLGERTTAPEVKNFVSALVQADRLGLPVAAVLREQTQNMRLIRRQLAEEKAQKVTVKILFPLLLCIFPALFIVIIGPGAIRMMEAFSNL